MEREEAVKSAHEESQTVVEITSKPTKRAKNPRSEINPQVNEVIEKVLVRMKNEEASRGAVVRLELSASTQNTLNMIKQRHMKEGLDFSTSDFLNKLIEHALGCDED